MDFFEFASIAPDQDHVRAMSRAGYRDGAADPAARAGDGYDTAGELIGARDMTL